MCMIKVRPEIEEEVTVPARRVDHRRTGSRDSRIQEATIIETVNAPPPPPSNLFLDNREMTTIIHPEPPMSVIGSGAGSEMGSHHHYPYDSPRASVVSTQSRDYYVDSSAYAGRSPRSSYRYVDARGSGRVDGAGAAGSGRKELDYVRGDRYGYNNYHGRRSGSVNYVNPRHSTASHRSGRSMREKVVVVDEYGREKFY
ncbi:hypothetical protein L873DRAFT_1755160 [Choiromyces venosus 120613-1]|uniref:Uncharacterized protein n=1 Tax=Choiromyces venosus 120613-1 TaxID=1336337 RepID=A0A3N4IT25_9PEZI|nr:hypothetical protein L873DRAFT_1755160 [Choiromyces venosus 120613-1]